MTSRWDPVRLLPVRPTGKELDADDPYELVGVEYPADADADREMARCIVEEYALVGWSPDEIRWLFASPQFLGPHSIQRRNGPELVEQVIRSVFEPRGCE